MRPASPSFSILTSDLGAGVDAGLVGLPGTTYTGVILTCYDR